MSTAMRTGRARAAADRPPTARVLVAGGLPLVAIALLHLGGCRPGEPLRLDDHTARRISTPETRHPIGFSERTEQLLVEVAQDSGGLTDDQRADVHRFLRRYRAESTGRLAVSTPAGRQASATARTLDDIRGEMLGLGIEARSVDSPRHPGGRGAPQIRLAYQRPVALPPACGDDWSVDIGRDHERVHYPNFGCADQRNTALFVANPRDLMGPQPEDPRPAEARTKAWGEYAGGGSSGGAGGGAGGAGAPAPKAGGAGGAGAAVKP
jgi:pilus assembly protein CpaD